MNPPTPSSTAGAKRGQRWFGFVALISLVLYVATNSYLPIYASQAPDSDYTFAGLPAGKSLRVEIIAANDAGQSPASDPAQIVVP